ncbi:MAG: bifunctional demethylmenaquinone methyltransferase/2-methoxy-6-polyprenyl-1,4-benzoquinol methylase UbiE [bacterium]|nr:bifunctional demethylmenaquinone methyltransferase/2-methoxy-6-polyprenyl-1,4-benzoquinol methylase UbiE [bacterium]
MSEQVQKMFSGIAHRYDRANAVLSFGIHNLWRKKAISCLKPLKNAEILDLCTGTGDLAFEFSRQYPDLQRIVATDFVEEMLDIAREKKRKGGFGRIDFQTADATNIPFSDASFDIASVAFGIRNVDSTPECLKEMKRVLKPGGQALILEFGQPYIPVFKQLFDCYSKWIMPRIGGLITGNKAAYEYLPETSKNYPCRTEFVQLMRDAGFSSAFYRPLFGGIAYYYIGNTENKAAPK